MRTRSCKAIQVGVKPIVKTLKVRQCDVRRSYERRARGMETRCVGRVLLDDVWNEAKWRDHSCQPQASTSTAPRSPVSEPAQQSVNLAPRCRFILASAARTMNSGID